VFWALLPLALKLMLQQLDVWSTTWYRFALSALIGLLWYGRTGLPAIGRMLATHPRLAALATGGLLVNYAFYILGLRLVTPGAAQIVIQLAPLSLLLAGIFVFRETFSARQWLGVAGFVLGLLLFFNQRLQGFVATEASYLLGMGLIVGGALVWTVYAIAQKKLLADHLPRDILLLIYIAGTLVFLPAAAPSAALSLDTTHLWLLAFVALNTSVAYGAFARAMVCWDASRVSAIITLTPLLTLAFGQLVETLAPGAVDVEPLNLLSWAGAGMVIAGASVAALAKSPARPA